MEKKFIPYALACGLKKLGFDEPCFGYFETHDENLVIHYNNRPLTEEEQKRATMYQTDNRNSVLPQWAISAPTWQDALDWFADSFGLHSDFTTYCFDEAPTFSFKISSTRSQDFYSHRHYDSSLDNKHACIEKLIELVGNNITL